MKKRKVFATSLIALSSIFALTSCSLFGNGNNTNKNPEPIITEPEPEPSEKEFVPEVINETDFKQKFEELSYIVLNQEQVYQMISSNKTTSKTIYINDKKIVTQTGDYFESEDEFDNSIEINPYIFLIEKPAKTILGGTSDSNYKRTVNSIRNIAKGVYKIDYTLSLLTKTGTVSKSINLTFTTNTNTKEYTLYAEGQNSISIKFSNCSMSKEDFTTLHRTNSMEQYLTGKVISDKFLDQQENLYIVYNYAGTTKQKNFVKNVLYKLQTENNIPYFLVKTTDTDTNYYVVNNGEKIFEDSILEYDYVSSKVSVYSEFYNILNTKFTNTEGVYKNLSVKSNDVLIFDSFYTTKYSYYKKINEETNEFEYFETDFKDAFVSKYDEESQTYVYSADTTENTTKYNDFFTKHFISFGKIINLVAKDEYDIISITKDGNNYFMSLVTKTGNDINISYDIQNNVFSIMKTIQNDLDEKEIFNITIKNVEKTNADLNQIVEILDNSNPNLENE